jgi:hypothetical protein
MARVSRKQLEHLADMVNRALESRGSSARLVVGARYDYHALDLTTTEYLERGHGGLVKTVAIGRTGELSTYMHAMLEAFWLTSEPYVEAEQAPTRRRAPRGR